MSKNFHHTAIVSPDAQIANDVVIGPYSIIGDNVKIDSGTILKSHIVIDGNVTIGRNNIIYPFVTIGLEPQDLKFNGEESQIIIGDNNKIRENVTIHLGTKDGGMITSIGNNCLFMVGSHIAHDCRVANNVILANNATLAGHVVVEDDVIVGGLSAIRQFVRIGKGAMIGGMSGVESDVIPYGIVFGERASLNGLNLIGLKRKNIARQQIFDAKEFFDNIFSEENGNFIDKINKYSTQSNNEIINEIANFIKSQDNNRSFCHPKK
jgi:UDP-N-acetylglucosamine acyltransferase